MIWRSKMIQRYDVYTLDHYETEDYWCKSSDVEQLEQQNKQLLDALINNYKDIANIVDLCDRAGILTVGIMRNLLDNKALIEKFTGKKPEE
jgi:hypothetical protein